MDSVGFFREISLESVATRWFASGSTSLLNQRTAYDTTTDANTTGAIILYKLTPLERMAVISCVEESDPNAIIVAMSTAIGTASTTIHARLSVVSSMMTAAESPLPASWSMNLTMNCRRKTPINAANAKTKGTTCVRKMCLQRIHIRSEEHT